MTTPYKPNTVVLTRADWKDLMRRMREAEVEEHRRQRRIKLAGRLKARRDALASKQDPAALPKGDGARR